jgi:DNA-binding transcriptional LysR family regulator
VDLGSFALAATRLGRSRSALSAQLRRLEEQAGTEVARAHPKVRIEARVARNADLLQRLKSGGLDLALVWGDGTSAPHGERLAELPMCWIGSARGAEPLATTPLPLAGFESPCLFRETATAALNRAGVPWRLAFTTASLGGLWAAAVAGVGLTVRTPLGLPSHVRVLHERERGLPALPSVGLSLHRADAVPGPAVERLAAIVVEAVREAVAGLPPRPAAKRGTATGARSGAPRSRPSKSALVRRLDGARAPSPSRSSRRRRDLP